MSRPTIRRGMQRRRRCSDSNSIKLGIPIYGVSWIPRSLQFSDEFVILSGGGGEGRSGIPNAFILSPFHFTSNSFLSHHPVIELNLGSELPYRMAVSSMGDGVLCALPKSCKWLEWEIREHNNVPKPGLKLSSKAFNDLEDIGQQLSVCFSRDASVLALGGEDGKLRIFKWPSMEEIANRSDMYTSVKDLDFSPDGKLLISSGSGGPCRIWDSATMNVITSLPNQKDEVFGFCRFCEYGDERGLHVFTTIMQGVGGSIVKWSSLSWKRVGSKKSFNDPISAFGVSPDGGFIAVGTVEGSISIINSTTLNTHKVVKNAHMGVVTALSFSHNSRKLLSASLDSSARVTPIEEKTRTGTGFWVMIFMVLLLALMVAFFFNSTTT